MYSYAVGHFALLICEILYCEYLDIPPLYQQYSLLLWIWMNIILWDLLKSFIFDFSGCPLQSELINWEGSFIYFFFFVGQYFAVWLEHQDSISIFSHSWISCNKKCITVTGRASDSKGSRSYQQENWCSDCLFLYCS